ncbi:hypothetical protein BC939DRAFT_265265 [Gamsiella multidivaricata]|uniref:uncharacterized protein n=1 Tax=Gamsiella multidivaricata TaxID=101098 RepID=UPI00221E4560|nr:uncharacterized protein BC939DRAFT_265265 [Gamsiella multidivaricata]KAI7819278.1 hypothetical protein BC939DRAFT_265265 [Gamsiella multidivaricata]
MPQQRPLAAQTYQPPPTHSHTENKNFMDSKDDVPRLFLIAPTLEEPLVRGPYRPIRILLPCQAPSSLNGDEESVHMTSHNGYTIKNPNDFLHNNRDTVKLMSTITSYFARAAAVGSQYQAALGVVGDLAATAAAFYAANADNRTHLNTAGLDTDSLYEMHLATENHQREALKILLMAAAASDRTQSMTGELNGIVLNNGRTIWVCKECYDHMLKGESIMDKYHVSLSDYETLTKRGPEVKVTLRSSASLIIFTNALWNNPETRNVTIRIVSEYFETPERSHRAALSSIQSLFSDLGQALASKRLTHLEIHGNSVSGAIYSNLQCVLKCSTLERLSIQGFPRFLQGANLPKDCKLLTKLMLDNVLIDTEEAANNFRGLMHANPGINHLRLSRAGFTHAALSVLFLVEGTANKAISVPKLFMRLVQLSLSDNNMDQISALTFVRMAFLSVNLTHLDLSGNPMIGDPGCRAIMTLLKEKSRKLVELKTERTGTEMRTRMELDQILSKSCS